MFILAIKFQTLSTETNEKVTKHFKFLLSLNEEVLRLNLHEKNARKFKLQIKHITKTHFPTFKTVFIYTSLPTASWFFFFLLIIDNSSNLAYSIR